jgi:hypothetical protein
VNTRTMTMARVSRTSLAIAAVAAIALSLVLAGRSPVQAADPQLDVHQQLPIDSATFKEDADCGGVTSGVVWHFTLVNYDGDDAQLFGEFADAGTFGPIDPADKPSNTKHFYVTTPDDDSLIDAYVELEGTITDQTQLQLSHVCHAGGEESVPQSVEQSVAESVEESVPESGEQSVKVSTGTPEESTPDGALSLSGTGALPTIAFSLILLVALGALAYANVKSARNIG